MSVHINGQFSLWRRTFYTSKCQSFCDIDSPQNLIYLCSPTAPSMELLTACSDDLLSVAACCSGSHA